MPLSPGDVAEANTSDAPYNAYRQDHEYEHDTGVVVVPVGGRTPKHRLIRLHGGVATRRVRWNASRDGKPPVLPTAGDTTFDTLLTSSVTVALPTANPSAGSYTFDARGEYLYVQNSPRIVGVDTLPTASFPFGLPMDEIATVLAKPILDNAVGYAGTVTDDTDVIGRLSTAIGERVIADNPTANWPFTFIPPVFTATTIIG